MTEETRGGALLELKLVGDVARFLDNPARYIEHKSGGLQIEPRAAVQAQ